MTKIMVEQFELSEDYINRLLINLQHAGVKNTTDLKRYLKDYSYAKDTSRKCHLLISPDDKKESFALPYE